MSKQLKKAIELAKKTGDRVIVFNGEESDKGYVILPFDEYEDLVADFYEDFEDYDDSDESLTQNEMIDNINRDVAEWKNGHSFSFSENDSSESVSKESDNFVENVISEGESLVEDENNYEKMYLGEDLDKKKSTWNIPRNRKTGAEEIIEEDRQYLEEIPF